jgi:hypothetical protein
LSDHETARLSDHFQQREENIGMIEIARQNFKVYMTDPPVNWGVEWWRSNPVTQTYCRGQTRTFSEKLAK